MLIQGMKNLVRLWTKRLTRLAFTASCRVRALTHACGKQMWTLDSCLPSFVLNIFLMKSLKGNQLRMFLGEGNNVYTCYWFAASARVFWLMLRTKLRTRIITWNSVFTENRHSADAVSNARFYDTLSCFERSVECRSIKISAMVHCLDEIECIV